MWSQSWYTEPVQNEHPIKLLHFYLQSECERLYCAKSGSLQCAALSYPPVHGTSCGDHMVSKDDSKPGDNRFLCKNCTALKINMFLFRCALTYELYNVRTLHQFPLITMFNLNDCFTHAQFFRCARKLLAKTQKQKNQFM